MAARRRGEAAYGVYRLLTAALSPLFFLHLHSRRVLRLEHPLRWPERFARPSIPRPPGPLLWFHAVSLGEGMAAIPVIKRCLRELPNFTLLMTTTTVSAFEVIKDKLPNSVIYQFAPIDTPAVMNAFLQYWDPRAVFLIESELWPNLILCASQRGIAIALLNARISTISFTRWSIPLVLPLLSLMLSKFSLIAPLSTVEGIRYQLLQAPPSVIHFAGDLKYAVGNIEMTEKERKIVQDLKHHFNKKLVWMFASLHEGEEEALLWIHKELLKLYPHAVTLMVPRYPYQLDRIVHALKREGIQYALRSHQETMSSSTSMYIVDTLGELRSMYRLVPIAVVGGSFLPGLTGHNISEAAAAGCAILTGPYVGHFSQMISKMKQINHLSVQQVSGKLELLEILKDLLSNVEALDARRNAAKQAFLALSSGIADRVWELVDIHILKRKKNEWILCKQAASSSCRVQSQNPSADRPRFFVFAKFVMYHIKM